MRSIRRWLFVAALTIAGVWLHALVRSGATLVALFDGIDVAAALPHVAGAEAPAPLAAELEPEHRAPTRPSESNASAAPASVYDLSPQQVSSDGLSGRQIRQLLGDELASDTDAAAADELLRAFDESLDAPAAAP